MYANHTVGVTIPAYNEEQLIADTLQSVPSFVDRIYAIDDSSTDRTAAIIQEHAVKDPRILYIHHEKNGGVGSAIYSGYRQALKEKMDIVAVMAGDNQMDPKVLPYLLDPIVEGRADYTKGNRLLSRAHRRGMSPWRSFGNTVLTFLTKVASGYWYIMDPQNGYTAISRKALTTLNLDTCYPGYGYCNDILVKLNVNGFRVADVAHRARYGREKSKIRYGRYIMKLSGLLLRDFFWRLNTKYAMRGFHPLYFFYLSGMLLSFSGFAGALYSLHLKFSVNGDLFVHGMLSLILFFIGLQFLFFAILFDMEQRGDVSSQIAYDAYDLGAAESEPLYSGDSYIEGK
jgi:glycosyltransferase involved in cell wall biosynthesis